MRKRVLTKSATITFPLAASERWDGPLNAALVPAPSVQVAAPLPASVDTVPLEETSLIRWLSFSPTSTSPKSFTATPIGSQNVAETVPTPLAKGVELPVPARVETVPKGVIFRMRWFPESATYTTPAESIAMPCGYEKRARAPEPSAQAAVPLPAKVVVTPATVTRLIL